MPYPYGPNQGMYAPPPPSLFGSSMGAMGGGAYGQQQLQTGQHLAGSSMAGMGMAPAAIAGMVPTLSMVGALGGTALAGGIAAQGGMMGGMGMMGGGMMRAATAVDPFMHMGTTAGFGMRTGFQTGMAQMGGLSPHLGRGAMALQGVGVNAGIMARMGGQARGLMQGGRAAWGAAGARGVAGFGARAAGAYGMGAVGGLMGAALPMAAGYAAYKGLEYGGQKFMQGSTDIMQGQALMNQMGSSVAPGQNMAGTGAATGRMMRDMSTEMGVGMEDVGRFAKQLNSQKMFQTTRSAKEFRDKFKEVMGAVKEIAQITQSSVDDAMKTFSDLKQQGFHTTADIKAQAASRQAREMTTGMSAGVMSAIGGVGSQMARGMGMRGRYGARLAEQNVAGVSQGVRSGRMSEEEVMEMGGAEQVGLRMSQQQMKFLGTSRGRAMTAFAMGEGGAPDPERLQRMLGGDMSMEGLVTGAAGRGLGVLRRAGSRESKEQMAQYAGMGMVSMAAMQQKQLHGRATQEGILGMMGTMGVGREEAKVMLQQTMQLPQQIRDEQRAAQDNAERQRAEGLRYRQEMESGWRKAAGPFTRAGRAAIGETIGAELSRAGGAAHQQAAGVYGRGMRALGAGDQTYDEGGDYGLAQEARRSGQTELTLGRGVTERRKLFGLTSASGRIQEQSRIKGRGRSAFGGTEEEFQERLRTGEIVNLGESAMSTVGRGVAEHVKGMATLGQAARSETETYVLRSEQEGELAAYREGRGTKVTDEQAATMRRALVTGQGAGRGGFGGAYQGAAIGAAGGSVAGPAGSIVGGIAGGIAGFAADTGDLAAGRSRNLAGTGLEGLAGGIGAFMMNVAPDAVTDLMGIGGLKSKSDIFTLAQKGKLIGGDVKFEDWAKTATPDVVAKLEGQVRTALEASGEEGKAMLKELGPGMEGGLLATRDLQALKQNFATKMGETITAEFGDLDGWTGTDQTALADRLTTDSGARQAYSGFMDSLLSGESDKSTMSKLDALAKSLPGGKEDPAYRAAVAQMTKVSKMSKEEKDGLKDRWGKGGRKLLTQRALGEATARGNDSLRSGLASMSAEMREDERWAGPLKALGATTEKLLPAERAAAMDDLFGKVFAAGGVDEDEIAMLNALATGAGSDLGGLTKDLMRTEGKLDEGTVRRLGREGETEEETRARLDKIGAMKGDEQAAALKEAFGGLDVGDLGTGDVGGTSTAGVQNEYIEKNRQFVQAVHAFAAAMNGVQGFKFEGSAVADAGAALEGEAENTGP